MNKQVHSFTRSSWFDAQEYPFQSHFLKVNAGKLHYVDEGQGDPILFLHGTPVWSFLYRNQIKALSKTNRCIAPDHLGFGLSDKPEEWDYRPESHAQNLSKLVEKLDLRNITLVVHDFGGPIGLGFALQHPERIKRVVLMNTWLWETAGNPDAQKVAKILNGGMGRFMYLKLNFSPKVLLKQAFLDKAKLTKTIHHHYTKVFPSSKDRHGLLKIGQALVGESDWYGQQWANMDKLKDKPFLILWGMKDAFIKPDYLNKWEDKLTNFRTVKVDCGHFVQEEAGDLLTREMKKFLAE